MSLDNPSTENLAFMLEEIANKLSVVNRVLFDPDDYDLNKYDDLKFMYDIIMRGNQLSPAETDAFIDELSHIRK